MRVCPAVRRIRGSGIGGGNVRTGGGRIHVRCGGNDGQLRRGYDTGRLSNAAGCRWHRTRPRGICLARNGNCHLDAALLLLLLPHDERVEDRYEEERDEGGAGKSADDRHADRLNHARASARREAHGEHAEDRRQRRHKDGAQAARPGLKAGLLHLVAAVNQKVRVVNQDDTVVDDDSDQHDDSDG